MRDFREQLRSVGGGEVGSLSRGERRWFVKDLLAVDQVCLLAGPEKSCKTSIALDLAISIVSGKPFLGRFPVVEQTAVMFFSGESGEHTLCDTARAIAATKGLSEVPSDVLIVPHVPKIRRRSAKEVYRLRLARYDEERANERARTPYASWDFAGEEIRRRAFIRELKATCEPTTDVSLGDAASDEDGFHSLVSAFSQPKSRGGRDGQLVIIDPICLTLSDKANAADLASMVQELRDLVDSCGDCSCVMLHHAKKALPYGKPLGLADVQGAGFGEFARQWVLVNRRRPFDPAGSDTTHRLLINYGGSAGHAGGVAVDLDMGKVAEGSERRWVVEVMTPAAAKEKDAAARVEKQRTRTEATTNARVEKLMNALPESGDPLSFSEARSRAGMNATAMQSAIAAAGDAVKVERLGHCTYVRRVVNRNSRKRGDRTDRTGRSKRQSGPILDAPNVETRGEQNGD